MAEKKKMVTAVFRNRLDANGVFEELQYLGYPSGEVDVLMSAKTRSSFADSDEITKHDAGTMAQEGMAVGGAVGTAVGATLAAVAAIGTSLALPGLGIVIAGPIAAALAGGGAGAVAGGVIGTLIGFGISEENAQSYQEILRQGGVVLGVSPRTSEDASKIQTLFKDGNGENIIYS
jgi:hypothetical protein